MLPILHFIIMVIGFIGAVNYISNLYTQNKMVTFAQFCVFIVMVLLCTAPFINWGLVIWQYAIGAQEWSKFKMFGK